MKSPLIEACVDSYESCKIAVDASADRLELCSNLIIGGTTPSPSLLKRVISELNITVNVLIRPRFGDFLYNDAEILQMCDEIKTFNELGANGVVIGCLTADGRLNREAMRRLIDCAADMDITLHRAFDMTRDPFEALEDAAELGVNTILTSGQAPSVKEGTEILRELYNSARGMVDIMAGAGVNSGNIADINSLTGITSFHTSARRGNIDSGMTYRKSGLSMGLPGLSEYEIYRTDAEEFKACANIVHSL